MQFLRKNQWNEFHANLQRLGLHKWPFAEGRIVGDGNIIGRNATRQKRKREVANLYLPPESTGQFRLDFWPEGIRVDQKGKRDRNYNQNAENDSHYFQGEFHECLPAGTATVRLESRRKAAHSPSKSRKLDQQVYHCSFCCLSSKSSGEGTVPISTCFSRCARRSLSNRTAVSLRGGSRRCARE